MTVLWYVHDHGVGHLQRARCVVPRLRCPTVVAAGPGVARPGRAAFGDRFVELPSDVPAPDPVPTTGPWHHAPAAAAVRARGAALAEIVARRRCTTAVVDVSMETVVLMRLLGLRVVALRQSGTRDDTAHTIGLDSADAVWVPQRRDLEPALGEVDERWHFTGPFSLLDDEAHHGGRAPRGAGGTRLVVLLVGRGGHGLDVDAWRSARAPVGWEVVVAGDPAVWTAGAVRSVGIVEEVGPLLAAADVVVTSAGWASVADVVAAGARPVLVPEPRPFGEQDARASALGRAGLAVVRATWPTPVELGGVVEDALRLDPAGWRDVHDGRGAARAARLVEEVHA